MKEVCYIDRVGDRYGRLVVLERAATHRKCRSAFWLCRCDCGNETTVEASALASGGTKSCGCLRKDLMSSTAVDIVGMRFGMLVVTEREYSKKTASWRCVCDCGKEHVARGASLRAGHTTSCGCAKKLVGKVCKPLAVGEVFGRLTVARQEEGSKQGSRWLCACSCGGWIIARGKDLRGGNTKSCGCLKSESARLPRGQFKKLSFGAAA